jgi:dihydroorotate dehydrogenase (fumarate)
MLGYSNKELSPMNLSTKYLGLDLNNPLVPSASPLTRDLDTCKKLEDAGAAALVMYSIFEEDIEAEEEELDNLWNYQDIGDPEMGGFLPSHHDYKTKMELYLEQIAALKLNLDIPIIASLNGISVGGWVRHAKEIEQAGADALELNVYLIAADSCHDSAAIEQRYINILRTLNDTISLPITLKLSNQFSALTSFVKTLEQHGAKGVSLFNRFYQPDINLNNLKMTTALPLSHRGEVLERMRWAGILHNQTNLSVATTGGIHEVDDIIKLLLCGADVTHLCSTLLRNGPEHIATLLTGVEQWLEAHEYESVEQLKGSFSQQNTAEPEAYQRANYLETLNHFSKFDFSNI